MTNELRNQLLQAGFEEAEEPKMQLEYYKIFHIPTASFLMEYIENKGISTEVVIKGKPKAGQIRDEYRSGGLIALKRKTKYKTLTNKFYFLPEDLKDVAKAKSRYVFAIRSTLQTRRRELQKLHMAENEFELILVTKV